MDVSYIYGCARRLVTFMDVSRFRFMGVSHVYATFMGVWSLRTNKTWVFGVTYTYPL